MYPTPDSFQCNNFWRCDNNKYSTPRTFYDTTITVTYFPGGNEAPQEYVEKGLFCSETCVHSYVKIFVESLRWTSYWPQAIPINPQFSYKVVMIEENKQ